MFRQALTKGMSLFKLDHQESMKWCPKLSGDLKMEKLISQTKIVHILILQNLL